MNNIGYHTRRKSDGVKLSGGSFRGQIDQDTIERLSQVFECRVTPSGSVTFVNKDGVDVWLYVSVDASQTEKGKAALLEYRRAKEAHALVLQKEQEALEDLLGTMTTAEAIERLSK